MTFIFIYKSTSGDVDVTDFFLPSTLSLLTELPAEEGELSIYPSIYLCILLYPILFLFFLFLPPIIIILPK